jgi:hypothetical protein
MYLTDSIPKEEIENYKKKFQNEPQRKSNPNEELIYNQNLTGLEGIYLNKELLITYKIFEKNDSLYAANSIKEILLKPLNNSKDKFVSDNNMLGDFIFERNQKGNVSGFLIKQRRDNIIKFTRIEKE